MCSMQFVLPNGTTLTPTREAGLVQIAITQAIWRAVPFRDCECNRLITSAILNRNVSRMHSMR
jgi:hypothetical protein